MSAVPLFAALLATVLVTGPLAAQSPGSSQPGVVLAFQDPAAPVFQWQQPRQPRAQAPRQGSRQAYRQHQLEQQRRWQAYQHQRRLEAERRWRAEQQRRWQPRAYGWHAPQAPWYAQPQPPQPPQQARPSGPVTRDGGPRPDIAPVAPEIVSFANSEEPGTIIIDTDARRLYLTLSESEAYAYPVAVGREGFGWYGTETVSRVAPWPDWHPPDSMRQREPHLPEKMTGGLNNPLGSVAIYLGDTLYRIHGTNDEGSIGQAASSGCFRLRNEHAVHLAELVEVGATVRVVESWTGGAVATVADRD